MASPKRTKMQRERDLTIITQLWLEKVSQTEIPKILQEQTGEDYQISQQQVSYDLKTVLRRMQKERAEKIILHRNKALAEIDNLKRQYWKEFKNATSDIEKKDALKGVQWCIEKEAHIRRIGDDDFAIDHVTEIHYIIPKDRDLSDD